MGLIIFLKENTMIFLCIPQVTKWIRENCSHSYSYLKQEEKKQELQRFSFILFMKNVIKFNNKWPLKAILMNKEYILEKKIKEKFVSKSILWDINEWIESNFQKMRLIWIKIIFINDIKGQEMMISRITR